MNNKHAKSMFTVHSVSQWEPPAPGSISSPLVGCALRIEPSETAVLYLELPGVAREVIFAVARDAAFAWPDELAVPAATLTQ